MQVVSLIFVPLYSISDGISVHVNIHIVGKFGFRQPLYFPFTLSYWGYGCGCGGEKGSRKYHHKGKHNKNNGEMINSNYWCLSYLYLGVSL